MTYNETKAIIEREILYIPFSDLKELITFHSDFGFAKNLQELVDSIVDCYQGMYDTDEKLSKAFKKDIHGLALDYRTNQ